MASWCCHLQIALLLVLLHADPYRGEVATTSSSSSRASTSTTAATGLHSAVSGALDTLHETLSSTKNALTGPAVAPEDAPPTQAQLAIEAARRRAGLLLPPERQPGAAMPYAASNADAETAPGGMPADGAGGSAPGVNSLSCDEGVCPELFDGLLNALEGENCRTLFRTGKCPVGCNADMQLVTSNASWTLCLVSCPKDVAVSSADRWEKLCGARTESLIDQGKQAVKFFVADSLVTRLHIGNLVRFLLVVSIVAISLSYGYRRGLLSAAARAQRRRARMRKNSDADLPL